VEPRLIVIRGNSGSGKSSVVEGIRTAYGRGIAYIEQDYVRRIIFQELDDPDGANIELIGHMARHALARGFHTVVEGIMPTVRYGGMLAELARDHDGHFFYLDIPFEETVRRHATRRARSRPTTWPTGTGRRISWSSRARRSSTSRVRSTRPSSRSFGRRG
jgi:predicted kinase